MSDEDKKKTEDPAPPITGQGEEETFEDEFTEPIIGSGEEVTGDVPEGSAAPDTGQAGDLETDPIQDLMVKKGFKSKEDLANYALNLEKQNTKLSQDVSRLSYSPPIQAPQPTQRRSRTEIPEDPSTLVMDKSKFTQFIDGVRQDVLDEVGDRINQGETAKLRARVVAKRSQDPRKFDKLQGRMFRLSGENQGADIDQLMQWAEYEEQQEEQVLVDRIKRDVLGGVDPNKLKVMADKTRRPPSISDGSGGSPIEDKKTVMQKRADAVRDAIFSATPGE